MKRYLVFSLILLSALAAFASEEINNTAQALPSAVKAVAEPSLPSNAAGADPADVDDSSLLHRQHRRMHAMMSSATGGVQDQREALSDLQRLNHAQHQHSKRNSHIELPDGTLADMRILETNNDLLSLNARHRDASEDFNQQPQRPTNELPPQTEESAYNTYNTQSDYSQPDENTEQNTEYNEQSTDDSNAAAQRNFKEFARFVESRYPEEFSFDRSHHVEDMHLLSDEDLTRQLIRAAHLTLASGQAERPTDIHVDDNLMMNVLFRSGVAELEESPEDQHPMRHRRPGHESRSKSKSSEYHKRSVEEREGHYTETENENDMSEQPQTDHQEMLQRMRMQPEPRGTRTKHTHTRY